MFTPEPRQVTVSTIPKPGVKYDTFLGLVWSAALLSLIAVAIRLYSRFRGPRRLFWDDAIVILAEMMVLTTVGLWQWAAKFMYYVLGVNTGLVAVPDLPRLLSDLQKWLHVQFAVEFLFYTTLVLVKLSILLFLKRLGQNVQGQKYLWWAVTIFSVSVYLASVGNMQYRCLLGSLEDAMSYCTSAEANNFTMDTLRANMALDVLSDFLIMLIPIIMIWKVRLPLAKKLAFKGLFSLTIITIVIAIVRASHVNASRDGKGQDDATYLWLWSAIQAPFAIIVSCLASFPQLFSAGSNKKPVWTPTDTYYQRLRSRMTGSKQKKDTLYDLSVMSIPDQHGEVSEHQFSQTQGPVYIPPMAKVVTDSSSGVHEFSENKTTPVLVPQAIKHAPLNVCYSVSPEPNWLPMQGNGITRQLEYSVTQQQQHAPQRPCSHCGHYRG